MKKLLLSSAIGVGVFALIISFAPATLAQTARSQAIRCTVAEARLQTRIDRAKTAGEAQTKIYTGLQTRLESVIENATANQYDVTALTAAQTEVNTAIETYTQKINDYKLALDATKEHSCGESDGDFVSSLAAARLALTELRTSSLNVRLIFREQVFPALKDYAAWLETNAPATETEENT